MKNLVATLIVCINCYVLLAQSKTEDNRLLSYNIEQRNINDCDVFSTLKLARQYKQANNVASLKELLETSLRCPLTEYFQRNLYLDLADLYYGEGQYSKSLEIIRLYESTKGKVVEPHNPWPKVADFKLAQKKARSFARLGLNDSAIKVLTPFVFYKNDCFAKFIDSTSYASVLNEYLSLLRKEYTDNYIKDELHKAERQFYYDHAVLGKKNGEIHHKVVSGFSFLNSNIKYIDMEAWELPGSLKGNYSSKGAQMEYFKATPMYLAIKNL